VLFKGKKMARLIYALVVIFLCSLIGTVVGELVAVFVPASHPASILLSTAITPGFHLPLTDLSAILVELQFHLKITVISLVGMIAGTFVSLWKIRNG